MAPGDSHGGISWICRTGKSGHAEEDQFEYLVFLCP